MRTQITRISLYQNAKMLAVIYMPIGLVYTIIGLAFLIMDIDYLRFTAYIFILAPLWLSLSVVAAHYFIASIYNFLASKIGGFEFEFTEVKD